MSGSTVITVGDELLAGSIVDSNAAWLSTQLRNAGFPVIRRETVPDQLEPIARAVEAALASNAVVLVTGGLGPTPDDLTREGVARGLGVPLLMDTMARDLIGAFFSGHGREMPEREHVQAMLPAGAVPLKNSRGTAPGILFEREGRLLGVLPGVPGEMEAMFLNGVLPVLRARSDGSTPSWCRSLTLVGIPESLAAERLGDLLGRNRNPVIGSYPGTAQVVLQITATASSEAEAMALLDRDILEIRQRIGPQHVAGEGQVELADLVGARLLEQGRTLAVAESLTGGMIAERLVSMPGISAVFRAGLVTYSDASKCQVLGVREETLRLHGAVSAECAREMAAGARKLCNADIGVSTTGIAGPTGEVRGKPVGTVYLGFATAHEVVAHHRAIVGDRTQIRERTAHWALDMIRQHLDNPART